MSELSNLTGGSRSDLLPGFVLSKPGLVEWGECEQEFARKYVAMVASGLSGLPADTRKEWIDGALAKIANGMLNWGREEFDRQAIATHNTPFLLYICLRVKHPEITRVSAATLLTPENQIKVQEAVLRMCGYLPKEDEPKNIEAGEAKSTGKSSSDSSANEESLAGQKSVA